MPKRCGAAAMRTPPPNRCSEAEDIAARGPMPLFMTQAHLLRARIALAGQGDADARPNRDEPPRSSGSMAMERRRRACRARRRDCLRRKRARRGKPPSPQHSPPSRANPTTTPAPAGPSPAAGSACCRASKRSCPPGHAGLAQLQAARDAYNAERDDYLRSTLAKDVEGYDPANDPIAAYLASRLRRVEVLTRHSVSLPEGREEPWNCPPTLTKGHSRTSLSPWGEGWGEGALCSPPPKVKKPSNPPTSPACLTRTW